MKAILVKYLKRVGYVFFLLFSCLILLEICFRFQFVDFYQTELEGLNTQEQIESKENNVLIFGDSFSAHPDSYVKHLRERLSHFNFINAAIPGTGIKQHQILFKGRIKAYKPKAIIYQFYVGNDFLDIDHPVNFEQLSFFRNAFWKVSEQFLVLQFINHRLAFLNKSNQSIKQLHEPSFSEELYNHRVKLNYKGDSKGLNNTILLKGKAIKKTYSTWKEKLSEIKQLTGDSIPVFLLIVPHNAQINNIYFEQNIALGAELHQRILSPNNPLTDQVKEDLKKWQIINPLSRFQQLKNNENLYYQNDPHLTAFGQEELGKIIIKKIQLKSE